MFACVVIKTKNINNYYNTYSSILNSNYSLLYVPRPDAPVPSPHPPPPHPGFCFSVLLYFFYVCFCFFFFFFLLLLLLLLFHCPPSIAELLSRPYSGELSLCSSLYRVNIHAIDLFSCISFCLYSVMLLFFSLYFICYLFVIMLWPRWFDWIPFDSDLCVVDVYVTLAFRSRRKNGSDFYVVDKCVS
jgi:hypothetical protein